MGIEEGTEVGTENEVEKKGIIQGKILLGREWWKVIVVWDWQSRRCRFMYRVNSSDLSPKRL